MKNTVYYGVMTEIYGDDTGKAEMIYSLSGQEGKPEYTEEIESGITFIKEWYGSKYLAGKALEMRKETLQKLAKTA